MKMKSIKGKIILPMVIILTVFIIVMTTEFIYNFTRYAGILIKERVQLTAKNLNQYLYECEQNSRIAAISASSNPDIIRAVAERDKDRIMELLTESLNLYSVGFFSVTDEAGIILVRSHAPELAGDSVLCQMNVQVALAGSVITCIEEGTVVKVSIRSGSPVYDSYGDLIGVISAGVRLDTIEAVDHLKNIFHSEVGVFLKDVRIATTITVNGERIIGTRLDPRVAKVVIENGEEYFGSADILSEEYSAYYKPLKNAKGEVFAVLFTGHPISDLAAERNVRIRNGVLIGLAGLVITILVLLFTIEKIIKPLKQTVRLVSEVTSGNMNVGNSQGFTSEDEIGMLTDDIYSLVNVIKSMINDLSQLTRDLNIYGDIHYLIDTNRYKGSYKEIIDGVKTLSDSISMMKKSMAVMDYLDTMISVVDFDYNLLYINRSLAERYGVDRENCIGRKCHKVIRNLDEPCPICQLPGFLSNDNPVTVANYHDLWDACAGAWLGGRAAIINWVDGSRVFLNSIYDESEKKNYEIQLSESLKKVEQASIAKSAFLANMSHEIRTPMNSIMGFSELAMDGDIPKKTSEYLRMIMENAGWLLQIINDILDISKVESGNLELEKIPFDLRKVLSVCESIIGAKAIEKNIELFFYAEPQIGKKLLGDPTRLHQVLINLLSNAVKFTDEGKVRLFITVEKYSDRTVTLRFEIKDTGIGMTPSQISRIFEPFMQADASTTRKYGGTGLGLAIVKNILDLMGSRLEIESTPGEGSNFSFSVTFDTANSEEGTHEPASLAGKLEKPVFSGEVLVCEDSQMNQRVIIEHLSRVGLSAKIALNGREGIAMVKNRMEKGQKPFDLIFMDIHMPVMDGIEAAPKIIELGSGTPIIAMTANVMSEDLEKYKNLGMENHISKPFTSQELWRCLLKHLKPVCFNRGEEDLKKKNENLQDQLKADFIKTNSLKFKDISLAIEAGDTVLAHRLAHTLKSNSGLIGETALQKTAAHIEEALKRNDIQAALSKMGDLKTELTRVLDSLMSYLSEKNKDLPAETLAGLPGSVQAGEILEKLEPLLKSGSPESLKMIDSLRCIPGSDKLIEQIEDFYFGDAVVTLEGLKEKLAC